MRHPMPWTVVWKDCERRKLRAERGVTGQTAGSHNGPRPYKGRRSRDYAKPCENEGEGFPAFHCTQHGLLDL
jgi:hypothetical protein